MRGITLDDGESEVFARAALALKYDDPDKPAPITESQILMPRRFDDRRPDLWSVFNRTQEPDPRRAAWPQRQRADSKPARCRASTKTSD